MTNNYDRIKAPKDLKANARTYRVGKNKGSGYKKRDLFLAGTSKTRRKKKKKIAEEHPLAKAFTGEFDSFHSRVETTYAGYLCGIRLWYCYFCYYILGPD